MRILIVRHGDPDYANDTLTEKGHREAQLLAKKLGKEKIDYIYCSPLGRAQHTCEYTAKALGMEDKVITVPLFREFNCEKSVVLPSGVERHLLWDMLPEFWTKEKGMYDSEKWWEHPAFNHGEMPAYYREVVACLDEIIARHGYKREGNAYKVERENTDTIAIFCHFGLEMMLLSRLCDISPVLLTHHFIALPTSLTTLYTEERREGMATFRCCGFGDVGHLYVGEEEPSFSGRFCEVFHSEDRHD